MSVILVALEGECTICSIECDLYLVMHANFVPVSAMSSSPTLPMPKRPTRARRMPRLMVARSTWTLLNPVTPTTVIPRRRLRLGPNPLVTKPAPRATPCSLATSPSAPTRMRSARSSRTRVKSWASDCRPILSRDVPKATATSSSPPSMRRVR
ncbi:hypothetical protein T310_8980, partial [Rasamsonia emersonii CBS 393.64]